VIVPGTLTPLSPVFISFSSKDVKLATTICQAIESRGTACWISNRDVKGGENFQEAIIKAIHDAKIMILVFSSNTNNSGEIKKELALASQNGLVVIPVRVEDVMPSGAFAYELSTRQWIDLFQDWEFAMEGLTSRIAAVLGAPELPIQPKQPENDAAKKKIETASPKRPPMPAIAIALAAAAILSAGAFYYWQRATPPHETETIAHGDLKRQETEPDKNSSPGGGISHQLEKSAEQSSKAHDNLASRESKPQADNDQLKLNLEVEAKPKGQSQEKAAPIVLGPPPKLSDIGDGGQVFRECVNCPAMVIIPPGKALIGSAANQSGHDSSEEPRREIHFKQAFAAGRDAVSYAEWDACVAEGGCNNFLPGDMGWGRGQQPVVLVSWDDAKAYTKWLSAKTGAPYRLLSEAEWEYAARGCRSAGCQDQIFWFGNKINPDRANYDWRYSYAGSQKAQLLGKPLPAGTNGPNPFGLFNSIGNVAQWVDDCWTDNLKLVSADGSPHEVNGCAVHVFRGGSWHDEPVDLRSAARKSDLAASRQPYIGFRVARSLTE